MVKLARIVIAVASTVLLFVTALAVGWWAFAAVLATLGYIIAGVLDLDEF